MIGKTISHYKILEKLGEGGMGVVYKAEDTKLERTVALKFLSPHTLGGEEEKARFIREAKAAASLDHPNICTVHEIDEAEEQTFIAMVYVDGQSLEEKVESGVLEINEALDIAIQVAEGLKEAHDKGIIHRDIKAANIMLTGRGRAKIMDFGLAKLAGRTRLTKTATIMGTVAYMSPEQASGEATIDHRTDIWSLGVVLYKMLTGNPPFDAPSDAAMIHKIIYEEMEPVSSWRSDIPSALEDAIQRMIHKNPNDRYEDMATVLTALKSIQSEFVRESADSGQEEGGESMPSKKTKLGVAVLIALLVGLCIVGIIFLRQPKTGEPIESETATAPAEEKTYSSIAVLPFVDMSPDKDQEYFCDGLSEALINSLTQLKDLRVIARTSAFSFKGKQLDIREIGKSLNVETVLEGSVQKSGNKIRITAQLVDTIRGHHLWSAKYDREMQDIFAIQDEISLAIVDKLRVNLLGDGRTRFAGSRTTDPEAHNLYLKGAYYLFKLTPEDMRKGEAYLRQAIEKDPNYARAYAELANLYNYLPFYTFLPPRQIFPKAKEAAQKALEIDDTLGEAHAALALGKMYYDWNWEEAEREFKRALELNPGNMGIHADYSAYLMYRTRFDEAIREIEKAIEGDPVSPGLYFIAGVVFYYSGRDDEALEAFKNCVAMAPNSTFHHLFLGIVYARKSMYEEALAEFEQERIVTNGMNPWVYPSTATVYMKMGKIEETRQLLNELLERSEQQYLPPTSIAALYFILGENDEGFIWLDKAYEARDYWLAFLKIEPTLNRPSADPRYQEMLRKVGLDK